MPPYAAITEGQVTAMKRRELILFFIIAFAIAVPAFVTLTPATPIAVQLSLLILGSYAPTIAALVVLTVSHNQSEWNAFRERLRTWRVGVRWYVVALFVPTAIWLAAVIITAVMSSAPSVQLAGLASFPVIFITNLGEEIGWRGSRSLSS
jgi:membrane protease YdiL (CAAX protease family)